MRALRQIAPMFTFPWLQSAALTGIIGLMIQGAGIGGSAVINRQREGVGQAVNPLHRNGDGMIDIRGAIFDMDGTLLDSMVIWDTVAVDYLKGLGITPNDDIYEAVRSMSIQQVCEHFCAVYGIAQSQEQMTRGINAMVEDFYFNRAPLKPGVQETLDRLKARGVTMCVATATDRYLVEAALRRTGILPYFGQIFTCTEVGSGKDEPEIFLQAMSILGTRPDDTMIFEDAPYAIITAKRAGFRVTALYDASADSRQEEIKALADAYYTSFEEWNKENA